MFCLLGNSPIKSSQRLFTKPKYLIVFGERLNYLIFLKARIELFVKSNPVYLKNSFIPLAIAELWPPLSPPKEGNLFVEGEGFL